MDLRFYEYLAYLVATVVTTVWVGTTLYRNGRVFLVDVLQTEILADSVNHLLVVGFYLVNLGMVALLMRDDAQLATPTDVLLAVVTKIGVVLVILGVMHFGNLLVLNRIRRRANQGPTPFPPQGWPGQAPPPPPDYAGYMPAN